jgi:hypothetical protein
LRQEQTGPIVVGCPIGLPQHINTGKIGRSRHSNLILCRDLLFHGCLNGRVFFLRQSQSVCKGEGLAS